MPSTLVVPSGVPSAVPSTEPHAWGWCVARYAALAGVALDADDALLLGAALGVELWGATGSCALLGTRPRAFDTLASVLGTPLLRYGGDADTQRDLLRTRASLGRPTLLCVRASFLLADGDPPDAAARHTPRLALAEPIAHGPSPVVDRVTVHCGPATQVERTWDEIVAGWERARADGGVRAATDEWYVWVPAGMARDADAWRAVLPLALAQQRAELAPPAPDARTGVALLRALRDDAATCAGARLVAWHGALLGQADHAAYGAGTARRAVARAVTRHADAVAPNGSPDGSPHGALRELADALARSAEAWDTVAAAPRTDRRADVCARYDRLLGAETRVVRTLDAALRSIHH